MHFQCLGFHVCGNVRFIKHHAKPAFIDQSQKSFIKLTVLKEGKSLRRSINNEKLTGKYFYEK